MCMCVCACVYVHVCMCMCVCACVYVHVCMCMCVHVRCTDASDMSAPGLRSHPESVISFREHNVPSAPITFTTEARSVPGGVCCMQS